MTRSGWTPSVRGNARPFKALECCAFSAFRVRCRLRHEGWIRERRGCVPPTAAACRSRRRVELVQPVQRCTDGRGPRGYARSSGHRRAPADCRPGHARGDPRGCLPRPAPLLTRRVQASTSRPEARVDSRRIASTPVKNPNAGKPTAEAGPTPPRARRRRERGAAPACCDRHSGFERGPRAPRDPSMCIQTSARSSWS